MPYLYYKQKAYGGTSTVNDSEHVIADNGSGSEITSQQLFENILGDLAIVEESTTASKAYEVGDYIILNSYFYKVTSAIALGGTITVGTNVVKTTVGDEFKTATSPVCELTKAQYDALSTAQKNDGKIYLITDGNGGWEAERSTYDNTASGLTATNVQDALDELNSKRSFSFFADTTNKNFNNFEWNSIHHLAGSGYSNSPVSDGSCYGVCETISGSDNQYGYVIQKCYLLASGRVYKISYRAYSEGSWHSWIDIPLS